MEGREFQAEGTATAKALRLDCAWRKGGPPGRGRMAGDKLSHLLGPVRNLSFILDQMVENQGKFLAREL